MRPFCLQVHRDYTVCTIVSLFNSLSHFTKYTMWSLETQHTKCVYLKICVRAGSQSFGSPWVLHLKHIHAASVFFEARLPFAVRCHNYLPLCFPVARPQLVL